MRCKACDMILAYNDYFVKKHPDTTEDEDLCSLCRGVVFLGDNLDVKQYAFQDITESFNIPRNNSKEY